MERKLRIVHEGKAYIVTVEELDDGGGSGAAPLRVQPVAAVAAPAVAAAAPAAATAAGPGDVVAPLGGVIQSVSVTVGQTVNQGETVAVLEAMKMNSVLTAPRAGRVARVAAKPGDAVEAGHVLVSIE